jgi:serine/threonine protein kinase
VIDHPVLFAALSERYRLERQLGAGGMATVYLAVDLKHGRDVAIQVLQPALAEQLRAERFLRDFGLRGRTFSSTPEHGVRDTRVARSVPRPKSLASSHGKTDTMRRNVAQH